MNKATAQTFQKNDFLIEISNVKQVLYKNLPKNQLYVKKSIGQGLDFNIDKVMFCLDNLVKFVKHSNIKPYEVIFLNTNKDLNDLVMLSTYKCAQNYMINKWVPGILTNWKHKHKDFSYYREVKDKFVQLTLKGFDSLDGSGKAKRDIIKEFYKIYPIWQGMLNLKDKPKLLIVTNVHSHMGALREAQRTGVPTIGLLHTNMDPELVTYPIPCDTNNLAANTFYLDFLAELLYEQLDTKVSGDVA